MKNIIMERYDFVVLFDVVNGNPNGNPDADNMPRIDSATQLGKITDVCIKRFIRNYVDLVKEGNEGFLIYVSDGAILNNKHQLAYDALNLTPKSKKLPKDKNEANMITDLMCRNFYDIRTFGAVMNTEVNAGQVTGPVQFQFSKSIDPIIPELIRMTRKSVTNKLDAEKERTMGHKWIVPYALYKMEGHISASLAAKTGFTYDDLELLWQALIFMFENNRSSTRGKMTTRKLIIFKHDSKYGNTQADNLFNTIYINRKDYDKYANCFEDYVITISNDKIPSNVELIEKL